MTAIGNQLALLDFNSHGGFPSNIPKAAVCRSIHSGSDDQTSDSAGAALFLGKWIGSGHLQSCSDGSGSFVV